MIIDHAIHIHTLLSDCCNDPDSTPANIIARAAEAGLKTIGFANHLWDSAVDGASDWYAPQDVARISQIRQQIPGDTGGVRVLFGCESEYLGGGVAGITPETAEALDFVLLPVTHFHMAGYVAPANMNASQVAKLMVSRFSEALELGLATGIAHPFLPFGYREQSDEIIALISDAQFADCLGRAAELGISFEITTGFLPSSGSDESGGRRYQAYMRVLTLAREAGCVFHFASDAHKLAGVGTVAALAKLVEQSGITSEDLHPLVR